jgi:hypothetical protein
VQGEAGSPVAAVVHGPAEREPGILLLSSAPPHVLVVDVARDRYRWLSWGPGPAWAVATAGSALRAVAGPVRDRQ